MAETGITDDAFTQLLIASELYPQDANLYDSIGDLTIKLGQKDKAIRAYEKALEIDPNYANAPAAREALKKLKQQ